MKNDAPMFGEYVKLVKTGEILKWKSYDPKTQMLEIELRTGSISTVHQREIERITPNEEVEFLSKKKKTNS
ncbi:MAG TPA: hypothetical protein VHG89_11385 [Verrucomicrobiae bacterium]|nr:hypothetical protein [Verrucomicrobiae bacterium]